MVGFRWIMYPAMAMNVRMLTTGTATAWPMKVATGMNSVIR